MRLICPTLLSEQSAEQAKNQVQQSGALQKTTKWEVGKWSQERGLQK